MTLVKNLFSLFALTIFGIASTILTMFNYNPFEANKTTLTSFYISFCVAITGIIAILIYFIKSEIKKSETVFRFFWPLVRQGFFISLLITSLLFFRSLRILDWTITISVIIVIILLELFFETKRR